MKHDIESILEALQKESKTGVIKLTKTMLDKHIIDANKSVRELAASIGISYIDIKAGEKRTIEGRFYIGKKPVKFLWFKTKKLEPDFVTCKVSFYKTKTRGDKRFSITGLTKQAITGDTIAITTDSEGALVINVNRLVEKDWSNE